VALVEQTVKIIQPYAAEREVSLAVSLFPSAAGQSRPLPVLDRGSIEQALLNLIDNAIKHSPPGQTVTVGLEKEECAERGHEVQRENRRSEAHPASQASPCILRLWVEDHGDGIPPGEHEKIFERFYRRGSELQRDTRGIGIGLSIVKHVVEGHGGRVLVRSAEGQGSRFAIELPMNSREKEAAHEDG
jgi:signal transduction histidine kinase